MKVQDKTFVITGAGGGIGSALVKELLGRGARVAAVDLNGESLQKLIESVGDDAARLSTHAVNITDREAVAALPQAVEAAHGAVDGVINNAGIIQPFVKVADLEFDAIERVMTVNFYGTLNMIKAFLPALQQRPEAHLVNVSSMGGFLPVPGQSVYGASKAAVKLLSEGLYAELRGTNVHVTTVFPGATETNITANSHVSTPGGDDAKQSAKSFKMLPPSEAARQVIDAVEKNKPQVFTGKDSKAMNKLYRLSPVRATNLIAKQMQSLLK